MPPEIRMDKDEGYIVRSPQKTHNVALHCSLAHRVIARSRCTHERSLVNSPPHFTHPLLLPDGQWCRLPLTGPPK